MSVERDSTDDCGGASSARPTTDFDREVRCLLGLPFDRSSVSEAVQSISLAARRKRRCFVTTPNLNYVVACRSDAALRMSVLRSDLSVPDGMPLIWAARLIGLPLDERVAGSSLVDAMRRPDAQRLSVFLFGGSDGVAATACEVLNADRGGLTCAGFHSPGFGSVADMSGPGIHAAIRRSDADFLMVALPARKGQMWILENFEQLAPPVVANLGAVINFIAGTVTRAPLRWQSLGLEWLWRIVQEPQLWRRYLADGIAFLGLLLTQIVPSMIAARFRPPPRAAIDAARVTSDIEGDDCRLSLSGAWSASNLGPLRSAFRSAAERDCGVTLDLAEVTSVDSACIALCMLLCGHQQKVRRRFTMRSSSPAIRRTFARHGATYLLA